MQKLIFDHKFGINQPLCVIILVSRPMFYGQEISWCHSFSPVTLSFQGYDLCKVTVGYVCYPMIQICSGITNGRVLNEELYAERLQKLIYLHLLTGCFMNIFLQSSQPNVS